jgi:septal ring factor EnvC (AmiA/AmiB activator)
MTNTELDELLETTITIPQWQKQADRVLESYATEAGHVRSQIKAVQKELAAFRTDLVKIKRELKVINDTLYDMELATDDDSDDDSEDESSI